MLQSVPSLRPWSRVVAVARRLIATACLVPAAALATVTINEQFAPATIAQGDTSIYTIEIFNDAGVPLTGANATVLLGSNISVTGVLSNSCGGTVTAAPGTGSAVVLTGGGVGPASGASVPGSCLIEVQVTSVVSGTMAWSFPPTPCRRPRKPGFRRSRTAPRCPTTRGPR